MFSLNVSVNVDKEGNNRSIVVTSRMNKNGVSNRSPIHIGVCSETNGIREMRQQGHDITSLDVRCGEWNDDTLDKWLVSKTIFEELKKVRKLMVREKCFLMM